MSLEQFKARLKAKAKTLGAASLSNARIDAIAARLHKKNPDITEDVDHDTRIDEFNELQPLADIAKEDDRIRTLEAKAKAQQQNDDTEDDTEDDNPPANPKDKKKKSDEPPAWAKSLIDEVRTLKAEKAQISNAAKLREKLKDKKIPETFLAKYSVEKEEDIDTVATQIETDFTALKQELVNEGLMSASGPPSSGSGGPANDKALDASIESWAKDKVEANKEQK